MPTVGDLSAQAVPNGVAAHTQFWWTVQLLDLESGETVVQLYQKGMSKESWPALQLTSDEALLAHMVNNTINIYKTRAFAEGKSVLMSMHALPLKCKYSMHVYHHCWLE